MTQTSSHEIIVSSPHTLAIIQASKQSKSFIRAARLLEEFFAMHPDAFEIGVYRVVTYRPFPSFKLVYDVFQIVKL